MCFGILLIVTCIRFYWILNLEINTSYVPTVFDRNTKKKIKNFKSPTDFLRFIFYDVESLHKTVSSIGLPCGSSGLQWRSRCKRYRYTHKHKNKNQRRWFKRTQWSHADSLSKSALNFDRPKKIILWTRSVVSFYVYKRTNHFVRQDQRPNTLTLRRVTREPRVTVFPYTSFPPPLFCFEPVSIIVQRCSTTSVQQTEN